MEGWKDRVLSSMGRITLIGSVFTSLPVYLLSNAIVLKSVILKVEQTIQTFLWGSSNAYRGVHLLGWHVVSQPIRERGLSIQSLVMRREALFVRHVARLMLGLESIVLQFGGR